MSTDPPNLEELLARLNEYVPITLEEAKRRRDVFMEKYGNELTRIVNEGVPALKVISVPRDVLEAVEAAFQHWPMRDENGEELVGNCCYRDPKVAYDHVLFKGIPVTYQADSEAA